MNLSFLKFLNAEWKTLLFSISFNLLIISGTICLGIWIRTADVRAYWLLLGKDISNVWTNILLLHLFAFLSWLGWSWQKWFYRQLDELQSKPLDGD